MTGAIVQLNVISKRMLTLRETRRAFHKRPMTYKERRKTLSVCA
jgi:hypothetical protein